MGQARCPARPPLLPNTQILGATIAQLPCQAGDSFLAVRCVLDAVNAHFAVKNTGTTAFRSWRLAWTFADGQVITNLSGANYTQVGANVTATSLPWDSVIPPGSTMASIGFYATWNNVTNSIPQVTCETS